MPLRGHMPGNDSTWEGGRCDAQGKDVDPTPGYNRASHRSTSRTYHSKVECHCWCLQRGRVDMMPAASNVCSEFLLRAGADRHGIYRFGNRSRH